MLTRIPDHRYSEIIGEAFRVLPEGMVRRLGHVQFVCGVHPAFSGLHHYQTTQDGRSYREVAHCCYPEHIARPASERVTTIVLPTIRPVTTVVHELGHALHKSIDLDHVAAPTTQYALTDHEEAFAEALTTWTHYGYGDRDVLMNDPATLSLFAQLGEA